jgi:hypothetical protein
MIYLSNQNIIESIDNQVSRGGVPPLVIDYIVVGGGGAGRVQVSGEFSYAGGGAGGFVTGSFISAFNVPFNIIVGAGAIASSANNGIGGLSSFSGNNFGTPINIIASGGFTVDGKSGLPQNNVAGTGSVCGGEGRYYGGGGAGGMRAGYNASCFPAPNGGGGGDAIAWYSGSFAGGGGGGVIGLAGETPQAGGGGGSTNGRSGGNGGQFTAPGLPPVQNSGGGGGGNGNNNLYPASNGASGSVILRYPYIDASFGVPYATGGDKYVYDGYVYHRFNSDGVFATFAR